MKYILTGIGILLILVVGIYAFISSQRITIEKAQPVLSSLNKPEDIPLLSTIAENLEVPWALAFLPNGDLLITERKGQVRLLTKDGNLLAEPLLTLDVVKKVQGEGGLHGITIHPDFVKNNFVFVYYTYETRGNESLNRVSRFTYSNNKLIDETIIVDKIPGALFHDGGRIKFDPDGFLYITTGDAQNPSLAQDKNSLAGKILKVTDSGKPAPNNQFNSLVYSYGHRNPQGITWDNNGILWETEHGQSATDEINKIESGKNYGWPTIQGDQKANGMETPIINSGKDTWAPGAIAFLNNTLYFVGLRGEALYAFSVLDNTPQLKTYFKNQLGRIREIIAGSDGMLYITTSNQDGRGTPAEDDDKIIRVNPNKL